MEIKSSRSIGIWYVSPQRLCNFHCSYCVSVNDYAKSDRVSWRTDEERASFDGVVNWLGTRGFRAGIRLATVGEPFMSDVFLRRAGWLTRRENVDFVELLTNASLLRKRLPRLAEYGELRKLSLWATYHHTQMPIEKFLSNVTYAHGELGCFVVVNGLLFPDSIASLRELAAACKEMQVPFNLDLGYSPETPRGRYSTIREMLPISAEEGWFEAAINLGANERLLNVNRVALGSLAGLSCSAGCDYFFIGTNGDIYPCSRYCMLGIHRLGNVMDPAFELRPRARRWAPCEGVCSCCNKEDFLHLEIAEGLTRSGASSLGWVGGTWEDQGNATTIRSRMSGE